MGGLLGHSVGLFFILIPWLIHRQLGLYRLTLRTPLLHHMGQFMGQQLLPPIAAGIILPLLEENIGTGGKGTGL